MKRPWLQRWMKPLSEWYFDNAGYRKLGLRYVGRRRKGAIYYLRWAPEHFEAGVMLNSDGQGRRPHPGGEP